MEWLLVEQCAQPVTLQSSFCPAMLHRGYLVWRAGKFCEKTADEKFDASLLTVGNLVRLTGIRDLLCIAEARITSVPPFFCAEIFGTSFSIPRLASNPVCPMESVCDE